MNTTRPEPCPSAHMWDQFCKKAILAAVSYGLMQVSISLTHIAEESGQQCEPLQRPKFTRASVAWAKNPSRGMPTLACFLIWFTILYLSDFNRNRAEIQYEPRLPAVRDESVEERCIRCGASVSLSYCRKKMLFSPYQVLCSDSQLHFICRLDCSHLDAL